MKASSAVRLPVLIAFPGDGARAETWGRFVELSAGGGRLSTLTELSPRGRLALSFELAGESFREVPAEVTAAELDADGYCAADFVFRDEVERRRLARALLDVLSRA